MLTNDSGTVVDLLIDAAEHAPGHEALVYRDVRLSYEQFYQCVITFAQDLAEQFPPGDRIALVMANSPALCIAMFGTHMARCQVVPLNPNYTFHELQGQLATAQVSAIVVDESTQSAFDFGAKMTIRLETDVSDLLARAPITGGESMALPERSDPATLQFTGGTTGKPKAASMTHGALRVNLEQRAQLIPARRGERMLCVMPLFHCYAINMCLHNMVQFRGTLVIVHPYSAAETLEVMQRERITLFGGSPTLLSGLINHTTFGTTDFSRLDVTYSGSAPLSPDLLNRWQDATESLVIEGYGQSESGPVISFNPLDGPQKAGSVGLPLPGVDVEVIDAATGLGTERPNIQGEIRVAGPQIMTHYFNAPIETSQAIREDWLYTGDIGEFDEDGYLTIRGRSNEMLLVSGYNVYPREIEDALCLHESVQEAAVVARQHDHRGEVPVGYVVISQCGVFDEAALLTHCESRLTHYKRPVEILELTELPKTPVGKLDRAALTRLADATR